MLLDDCKIYPKFLLEESLSTHASFYTARSLTERLFYSLCLLLPYIHKNFLQSANLIKSSSHECIRTQVLFVNWRTSYYITSCFLWASLYHRSSSICKSTANEQTLLNGKHDASELLSTTDFTQLGWRVNFHHTVFTWMQNEIFPLNLALKCEVVWNSSIQCQNDCAIPDCSESDHKEPSQGLYLQSSLQLTCINSCNTL